MEYFSSTVELKYSLSLQSRFDLLLPDTVINLKNSLVVFVSLSLCICIAVPFDLVLPASGGEVMN